MRESEFGHVLMRDRYVCGTHGEHNPQSAGAIEAWVLAPPFGLGQRLLSQSLVDAS